MAGGHESLPRESRLRGEAAFARVFEHRRSVSDGAIVLYGCPRDDRSGPGGARLGLSVSRRVGNAIARNRWKRRIREAFRRVRHDLPEGNDFVVVARPGPSPTRESGPTKESVPTQESMERSLVALARRLLARPGYADPKPARPGPRHGRHGGGGR